MSDFTAPATEAQVHALLYPFSIETPIGQYCRVANASTGYTGTTGVWVANRAVFSPVVVHSPVVVTQLLTRVQTQSGSFDMGIYDWAGRLIVSTGATGVPAAAAVNAVNIPDTLLLPGWYQLALSCDNGTAVFRNCPLPTPQMRVCGFREQAAAYPLPASATPVPYATAIAPIIAGQLQVAP